MWYRIPLAYTLSWCASLLPAFVSAADDSSASASARITLRVGANVQLRPAAGGAHRELCLRHIPAQHYDLLILPGLGEGDAGRHLRGRSGNYCVPLAVTEGATADMGVATVMIVAQ